jgi:hypothetical protein
MSQGSQAFVKGGCGCLLAFAALGAVALMAGGRVRINCGGVVLLFLVGGVIGLVALAVFGKRRRDDGVTYSPAPPRSRVWTCVSCGSDNDPSTSTCANCHEPR